MPCPAKSLSLFLVFFVPFEVNIFCLCAAAPLSGIAERLLGKT